MLQCYLKSQGFPEVGCCVWMNLMPIESFTGTTLILTVGTAVLFGIFLFLNSGIFVWLGVDGSHKAETISLKN